MDRVVCHYCFLIGHDVKNCKLAVAHGEDETFESKVEPNDCISDADGNLIPLDPLQTAYNSTGEAFTCNHESVETLIDGTQECFKCEVGRINKKCAWRPLRYDGNYEVYLDMGRKNRPQRQKKKQKQSKVQGKLISSSVVQHKAAPKTQVTKTPSTYKVPGMKDRHDADPYTTYDGSLTFLLSSVQYGRNSKKETVPDWGLYFDWSWKPWWRAEHIDWPDFDLPEVWEIALEQLIVAVEKAQSGMKVELGCIGAHGRTGTAVAAINVILGSTAAEAIAHVRKNHCEHAIENATQEWWVEWVEAELNGTTCREKPAYEAKSFGYSYGGGYSDYGSRAVGYDKKPVTSTAVKPNCSIKDHFFAWLDIDPEKDLSTDCPSRGKACSFWRKDIGGFRAGKKASMGLPPTGGKLTDILVMRKAVNEKYLVPKPTFKQVSHKDEDKCLCDTCRYRKAGHGFFLRPAENAAGARWDKEINELEARATEVQRERKLSKIRRLSEGDVVKVATKDNSIIEMPVSAEFKLNHKQPTMKDPRHGSRQGEFVFLDNQGWVWEALTKVNV